MNTKLFVLFASSFALCMSFAAQADATISCTNGLFDQNEIVVDTQADGTTVVIATQDGPITPAPVTVFEGDLIGKWETLANYNGSVFFCQ